MDEAEPRSQGDAARDAGREVGLREEEVAEVEARSAPRPQVVYTAVRQEGEEELSRPASNLFFSGIAAGLSMGFSLVTEGLLRAALPDAPWRPLVTKLGYSMGFLIVVLGRQQLFTENTLTVILPLLAQRSRKALLGVARLWGIVFVANSLGAAAIGTVLARTAAFEPRVREAFLAIAAEGMGADFATTVLHGVFAGWLIALMVWLLPAADTARVPVIIAITWLVGVGRFSHIIAGTVDVWTLVSTGRLSFADYLLRFAAPTLLGNVLGGVSLVAALSHAQVTLQGQSAR